MTRVNLLNEKTQKLIFRSKKGFDIYEEKNNRNYYMATNMPLFFE